MATYTVSTSKHATLAAGVADLVILTGSVNELTVIAYGAEVSDHIYFNIGDNPATATVAGNNTNVAPLGIVRTVKFDGTNAKVSLISSEATQYSVIAS
jgi:hypothetical protein